MDLLRSTDNRRHVDATIPHVTLHLLSRVPFYRDFLTKKNMIVKAPDVRKAESKVINMLLELIEKSKKHPQCEDFVYHLSPKLDQELDNYWMRKVRQRRLSRRK